jgi:hypothetical protein
MDQTTNTLATDSLYERDLYAWCEQQVARLRERAHPGANDGLDYENLAEEIEALARSQKTALRSHMVILLLHLLKWRHQPARRGVSWENSIFNARKEIGYAIDDSPSLRRLLGETIEKAYPIAMRRAESQTKLPRRTFPETCPYSEQQVLDLEFLPTDLDEPQER